MNKKIDSLWIPRNITPIDGSCYETIDSSFSQEIFSYLKMITTQCGKNIRVEDKKKEWVWLAIYNTYTYYMWMAENKNDSINSLLQCGRVADKKTVV